MTAKKRPTLLVVAHGSRSRGWTQAVNTLVEQMVEALSVDSPYGTVRAAFLEHAAPSIPDALDAICSQGRGEVDALPLFLTRSGHLETDVPAAIDQRARLLPPLPPPEWLADNLMRRLTRFEGALPQTSGVALVAYGSSTHGHLWDAMLDDTCQRLQAHGVARASFAYVGHVAQLSPDPTRRALLKLAATGGAIERLCVLPVLFGVGMLQQGPIEQAVVHARQQIGMPVAYGADAILPDPELARALLDHAMTLTLHGPRPHSRNHAT